MRDFALEKVKIIVFFRKFADLVHCYLTLHMKKNIIKTALESAIVAFLMLLLSSVPAYADAEGSDVDGGEKKETALPIDRWAFKTNAFEWLLTIPNFGVEYDLKNSEFNRWTVGLTAKYNWNTAHKYSPPTVFNLLDIRPEVRYYYRTVQKGDKKVDDDGNKIKYGPFARKNPKPWRAWYLGGYVDYASYTFKFGKTGHQGHVAGLGATLGYGLPLYQYNSGVIDLELGLAVGLQVATHEKFVHNSDGYFYTKLEEESRGMHFTPFPVLSEVKVAFVWRHKSIKDKVQEDEEKKKMDERIERARKQIADPFTDSKAKFDEQLGWTMDESDIKKLMLNDSLYRATFLQYLNDEATRLRESTIPNFRIDDAMKEKLSEDMDELMKDAVKEFHKQADKAYEELTGGGAKAEKGKKKSEKKDGDSGDKSKEKPAKEKKEKVKKEKVKKEKPAKEKKEKTADKEE